MMMNETFVYMWIDRKTSKKYIGVHKGSPDDGYICSSKIMLEEYNSRPNDFERTIISFGEDSKMRQLEESILSTIDAKNRKDYYNQHNGNGDFVLKSQTKDARRKLSISKMGEKILIIQII